MQNYKLPQYIKEELARDCFIKVMENFDPAKGSLPQFTFSVIESLAKNAYYQLKLEQKGNAEYEKEQKAGQLENVRTEYSGAVASLWAKVPKKEKPRRLGR